MRLPTIFLIATSLVAIAAECAIGQPDNAPQPAAPSYRSTTRAVVVDVVVAKGEDPILGLHQRDFQVFEDGKPQVIDFFEEHTARSLASSAVPPLPKMPPGVYTNVPPAPPSDSVNVLLLDALNTDQQDQSYVRQNLLKFLKNMQPGTRAAIFILSSRLRMIQGFTSDSSALVAALNDPRFGDLITKPTESHSLQDRKDDIEAITRMLELTGGRMTTGIQVMGEVQRDVATVKQGERVGMTLEALEILARYLAGVPGRKNLIWFSSDFPVVVFPSANQSQRPNQMNTADLRDYGKAIRQAADMLTVSKVAVYPIGAEGVMTEHLMDPDVPGPTDDQGGTLAGGAGGRPKDRMTPYVNENAARSDKIMSMQQLAEDTGGKAFFNTNDLNLAAQKAIADGAHYYTLAYTPANKKMDGSYRRIEIKVSGGKYRLAYRHGYNADDSAHLVGSTSEGNPLHALMMRGMPDSTQILYAARVVPATPQPAPGSRIAGKNAKLTGPTLRYSIDFMIRWTDVKLDPTPTGNHTGKIQVELLAYDREGNALNWAGTTQAMNVTPDLFSAIQKSGVPAHLEVDLPADKDIFVATGVYDWETGKAGTMEIPLPRVGAEPAKSQPPAAR